MDSLASGGSLKYITSLYTPENAPLFIGIALFFIVALVCFYIYLRFVSFRKQKNQKSVLLEVRPPAISLQSSFSTSQLFTVLHAANPQPSFTDSIFNVKRRISYEIVSDKENGIRYFIYAPEDDVPVIRKNLTAYLPGTSIHQTNDYLPDGINSVSNKNYKVIELKLKKPFVLPLQEQNVLNKHDPIGFLTGHMTKLQPSEMVSLHIVTTPLTPTHHAGTTAYIQSLQDRIYRGKEIVSYIRSGALHHAIRIIFHIASSMLTMIVLLIKDALNVFIDLPGNKPSHTDSMRILTDKQKEIQGIVENKLNTHLFEVSIRIFITASSEKTLKQRIVGLTSSFETFTNPGIQSLIRRYAFPFSLKFIEDYTYTKLKFRLFSFISNPVLSATELASIYHFPFTETTKTEDLQSIRSVELPAPVSLKKLNPDLDIVFAQNTHGESITPIGLTLEERRRHMYAIGATGTGKTMLLLQMIYQDMINGKGLAVLDPHGDLVDRILGVLPKSRINDVVYFNPYDVEHPVGLNVMTKKDGLSESDTQREKDLVVSSIVSIFHKLYPARYSGPRMEHVLRNTILTALELEDPTLFTVYKLLTNKNYRTQVTTDLSDQILKDFWKQEFGKMGSYQQAELISPITNKLGRFLTTKITRNILNQKKSKLDFEDIMNNRKILICDLSKGKIGEDTSSFLGSLVIAKLQLAALNRVHVAQEKRTDFFLYIDEFQNFATTTFAQILSEARKYRLNTILAHQTISQIDDKGLLQVILANVGTVISFRTSNPSDEQIILPLFSPQVAKNDIANLPSYNFYIKINALRPQDAFTGTTENFTVDNSEEIKQVVVRKSRMKYGIVPGDIAKPKNSTTKHRTKKTTTETLTSSKKLVAI